MKKNSQTGSPPAWFDASGAFETCRVRRGEVIHLPEHLERLAASLLSLGIRSPEQEVLSEKLRQAGAKVRNGFVRILVRREKIENSQVIIHLHPGDPYAKSSIRRGVSVRTAATRSETQAAQAKHGERLGSILAKIEGRGAFETLRLGPHGYLTEGTVSNLFIVKHGCLKTAPPWLGVLEGVTRERVIKIAASLRMDVEESPFTRHDLFSADEAFLTNVLIGVAPIRDADGRRIGTRVPGPITRKLMRAIRKEVH